MIGLELSKLCVRVDTVRRRTLKQNEDHVAKGGFPEGGDSASDDEECIEDENDGEDNFAETKKKLGKFIGCEGADDDDDEDFEDYGSDDDSDFDPIADCDLYDSRMDKIDELEHTRETLATLEQNQP